MGSSGQNIHLWDWHRILIGGMPWSFLWEVLIRAAILYVVLMFFIRLMGKRVAAQLSLLELAIIVTLGAAVGVPLQIATQGLLPAFLVLMVAVIFQKGLAFFGFKKRSAEVITQGDITILCIDGRLLINAMRRNTLSRERLFSALRASGIEHLGEVCRAYMESNGAFTIIRAPRPRPGLTLLPERDHELIKKVTVPEHFACSVCGNVVVMGTTPRSSCEFCKATAWMEAAKKLD